ncbi:hypothetical protein RSSM_03478 [Rhodopirellula sallentina SM41]|uniref:Uncharacterized protein n=1 Tax=Rhodopirellula sallentina SM41 TaxID=1263870 RepID=M5U1J6_9BACT|nr:hypothetical protein RSSM_03478 [Rhodopirellula sallentina SM41]
MAVPAILRCRLFGWQLSANPSSTKENQTDYLETVCTSLMNPVL